MARKKSKILTETEQRIMRVLWDRGEASVRDVTDALKSDHGTAYTTVLTQLRILADKGCQAVFGEFYAHSVRTGGEIFFDRPAWQALYGRTS